MAKAESNSSLSSVFSLLPLQSTGNKKLCLTVVHACPKNYFASSIMHTVKTLISGYFLCDVYIFYIVCELLNDSTNSIVDIHCSEEEQGIFIKFLLYSV